VTQQHRHPMSTSSEEPERVSVRGPERGPAPQALRRELSGEDLHHVSTEDADDDSFKDDIFPQLCAPGDIIVGDYDFGCARESLSLPAAARIVQGACYAIQRTLFCGKWSTVAVAKHVKTGELRIVKLLVQENKRFFRAEWDAVKRLRAPVTVVAGACAVDVFAPVRMSTYAFYVYFYSCMCARLYKCERDGTP
jgi:hypothetical protein